MKEEQVILVDKYDNQIGVLGKMEAHQKALLHRAISIFIVNSNGEWLLQRRAKDKYHSHSLWSNTCCTHPYPDESIIEAANRRLMEEMGMECELKKIFHFTYSEPLDNGLSEYEFDHVFWGICDSLPVINENEVMDFKYMNFNNLKSDIEKNPENYTVWFKKLVDKVQNHLQKNL